MGPGAGLSRLVRAEGWVLLCKQRVMAQPHCCSRGLRGNPAPAASGNGLTVGLSVKVTRFSFL